MEVARVNPVLSDIVAAWPRLRLMLVQLQPSIIVLSHTRYCLCVGTISTKKGRQLVEVIVATSLRRYIGGRLGLAV